MPLRLHIDDAMLDIPSGASLFEGAERAGVRVPTSCRKNGRCRECLVEVTAGMAHLSAPSPEEAHLGGAFRLACRARVAAATGEVRCRTLRRGELRIEDAGVAARFDAIDPAVTRRGDEVSIGGAPAGRWDGPLHGLAIDLGTTTVVVRLVDLESGASLGSRSFENPQRFGGSDIMARIQYDTEHAGRLLQRALLGYLGHAIEELGCDALSIWELVVVGNSTMRDLLFGLDVSSIGQRPYRSLTEHDVEAGRRTTTALATTGRSLRLPVNPAARVASLPLVRGHVGADAAACLLAVDMANEERLVALMDIGTNTELIVGNRERLFAASCPAGPAFEGGLVACAMPALEGAVERIELADDGCCRARVIGGGRAHGICGSGLVDLLAELRRAGRMCELGRFTDESSRVVVDEAAGVFLGEDDVSHLAQAKAANAAGLRIVLRRAGVAFSDLERFYLAGGFARHLRLDAARRIGLVPDLPDARIAQIGNAAIEGATIALLSASRRRELDGLLNRVTHVELETDPRFFDDFVDGCQFTPLREEARTP